MSTVKASKIGPRLGLAAICLALFVPVQAARAAEPGVVPDVTWGTSSGDVARTVESMRSANVQWARANVSWASLEPDVKGGFNSGYLAEMGRGVDAMLAAGIQVVMPMSDSVPYWASADPQKRQSGGSQSWNKYYRPAHMQDYADAFAYLVEHFAAKGVHVYEVWNEPNHPRFWPSGSDPAEFAQMLKAAYPAIKGADPQATVVSGGLVQNDRAYLEGIYANGAGDSFDAVGDHIYPKAAPEKCWQDSSGAKSRHAICGLEEMRRVMVDNGDAAKPIWITEMGYATCSNAASGCWDMGVSEQQQADYLLGAYWELEKYPWVVAGLWYNFRNTYWLGDDSGDFEATLGLLRTDFSAKSAYYAFRDYATGAAPAPTGPAAAAGIDSTATVVAVKRVDRARASVTRRSLRRRVRPRRMRVVGRVRGARSGVVKIEVDRRKRGRWRQALRRRVRVRGTGRFARPIRINRRLIRATLREVRHKRRRGAGRRAVRRSRVWRIRARYAGGGGRAPSVSRYRYFRVG